MASGPSARSSSRSVALLVLFGFVAIVLRHAWMMDDTYITLRTVKNFFDGYGLVWNVGERVQAYTHPLWMMLCCVLYAVTSEYFFTILLASTLISAVAMGIVSLRLSRSAFVGAVLVVSATLSQAFVDYSTSGLENPLTHLIIALSAWVYLGRVPGVRTFKLLCLLGGLSLLCRPDNALLLGPLVIAGGVQAWRRGARVRELWRAALIGGIPLWIWELFSLVYYGMLIPNTALAKLNTGIEAGELIEQGLFYFVATLNADPLTLVVLAAGLSAPILTRDRRMLPFAIGIGLSLVYVTRIGGDFMLGRQFTAPMFMALVVLSQLRRVSLPQLGFASAAIALFGLAVEPNTIEVNRENSADDDTARSEWKITNERVFLYQHASIVHASRTADMPDHPWFRMGSRGLEGDEHAQVARALGFRAFAAPSDIHYIDDVALGDPVLARLPALWDPLWMHGHFTREIPEGYLETIETGEMQIEDSKIRKLYERLDPVVHGEELFTVERFKAIWWLNTGGPSDLITQESWIFYDAAEYEPEELARVRVADGTGLTAKLALPFDNSGVYVKFDERQYPLEVELSVNDDDRFELRFYDGPEEIARVPVPRNLGRDGNGLMARRLELPEEVQERGFVRMRILPRTRKRPKAPVFSIGHLLFDDAIDTTPEAARDSSRPK